MAVDATVLSQMDTAQAGFWGQHAMIIGANAQNSSAVLNALQQQTVYDQGAEDSKIALVTPIEGGAAPLPTKPAS